jgi:hypothetical protein
LAPVKRSVFDAIAAVVALAFFGFVAVQYNDPDPLVWMLIYGGAGVASALSALRKRVLVFALVLAAIALPWSLTLATRVIGKQGLIESEEGREMLGLMIVAVWMSVLGVRDLRARKGH